MSDAELPAKKEEKEVGLYPGEGCTMSNYGVKSYTAEQDKEQWRERIRGETRYSETHVIASGKSAELCEAWNVKFSRFKTSEQPLERISYFNTGKKGTASSTYDRTFHIEEGYCSKLRRDDRQHTIGLDVFAEENNKVVPSLSSSEYGRRASLEKPSRKHVRVATVKRDFYRESGADITGHS